MCKRFRVISRAMIAPLFVAICVCAVEAQDNRNSSNQGGVCFQPPPGWTHQLLGPERKDGSGPVLTVETQNTALNLSDNSLAALAKELRDGLSRDGAEGVQVSTAQKRNIAGRDAAQIDLNYKQANVAVRERRVYVPIGEQNRTYLFTMLDRAEHFDQSATAADTTINSFTLWAKARADTGWGDEEAAGGRRTSLPLLIALGVAALALIIGAGYMLLQKRTRAS
jgi:hypothetical protein